MNQPEEHQMTVVSEAEDNNGYGEWYCPTCGRRLKIRIHPYDKIVLAQGNEEAIHYGGTGALVISLLLVTPIQPENDDDPPMPENLKQQIEEVLGNIDL